MSIDTKQLHGKFALVTDASRGIGRGIALRLAERGAAVAVNFLQNEPAALDPVARIKSGGGGAFAVRANWPRWCNASRNSLARLTSLCITP